jgi:aryl-alcohol dehydrogenase-like predicted oxidoreductase
VLATKFGHEMGDKGPRGSAKHFLGKGGEEARGSRLYMRKALDASLRRLQTDWIDLYQYHRPDRVTPLGETIDALDELVREGRIRAYGTSNHSVQQVEEAAGLAQEAYVSEQSEYSWLRRDVERDLLPACERLGLGLIPYFPLASGLLTGKVGRDRPPPPDSRLHGRPIDEADLERVERLSALAEELGVSLLQLAIGGLAAQPAVLSVIAGATKPEQVRANVEAGSWEPSAEQLALLRAIS